MLTRKKVSLISCLLTLAIVTPVFAYMYYYTTSNSFASGIILHVYETPTMKLGFYWDSACTQPATTFDFGNMTHPIVKQSSGSRCG